jgi:hypothetical protein
MELIDKAIEMFKEVRGLLLRHDPAADGLLDEIEHVLCRIERWLISERKIQADPQAFQELYERLLGPADIRFTDDGELASVHGTDEWRNGMHALKAGEFAEARRWCECAESKTAGYQ